jgi:PAS domain S-box-containing protein
MPIKTLTLRRRLGVVLLWLLIPITLFLMLVTADIGDQIEHYKRMVEAAPVSMIECNEEGVIEVANYETTRMFGWAQSELLGRPLSNILPEDLRVKHIQGQHRLVASLKGGHADWLVTRVIADTNARVITRDGHEVFVVIRLRVYNQNGKVRQIAVITLPPTDATIIEKVPTS